GRPGHSPGSRGCPPRPGGCGRGGAVSERRERALDVVAKAKALATALEAGGDRFDPKAREAAEATLARAGERLRLGGGHTIVALVDLLVWVVDPQKYADEALHRGYLRPLVGHDEVMVVVLNQVDKLAEAEVETCLKDLRRLLDADGLTTVRILATSARYGDGV